jgi:hypothetical protein
MGASHVVFGESVPDFGASLRTIVVVISLSLNFIDGSWLNRIERVKTLGVELDCRESGATIRFGVGHDYNGIKNDEVI